MLTSNEIKKQIDNGTIQIENMAEDALKSQTVVTFESEMFYMYSIMKLSTPKIVKNYLQEVLKDQISHLRRVVIPETGLLLEPHKVYLTKTVEKNNDERLRSCHEWKNDVIFTRCQCRTNERI